MKKLKLFTLTGILFAGLGSQALTTQAASLSCNPFQSGKGNVIISYGSNCSKNDIQNILDRLNNCLPGIILPDCNLPVICPPGSTPGETPDQKPEQKPEQSPDQKPEQSPEQKPGQKPEQSPENESAFLLEVVRLVNEERAKEGLSALTLSERVQAAAMVRAAECEQSFSHTRPDGSSFSTALKEQNVTYRSAGENIAWGQRSPEEVITAWMNSSGHRANIMNPNYTTIGVGYYKNANGTRYWCQLFTR